MDGNPLEFVIFKSIGPKVFQIHVFSANHWRQILVCTTEW